MGDRRAVSLSRGAVALLAVVVAASAVALVGLFAAERSWDAAVVGPAGFVARRSHPEVRRPDVPWIIPTPKMAVFDGGFLTVTPGMRVVVPSDAGPQDLEAVNALQRELVSDGVAPLPVVRERAGDSNGATKAAIVFGELGRSALVRRMLAEAGLSPSTHPEGYVLAVTAHGAVIAGHDPAGTFYGAQTLCQLLTTAPPAAARFYAVRVDDYPSLRWRGVQLFCGDHALPFHEKLIANILARFKMNSLVLQCEQAQWDALGGAPPPWAMPKAQLAADIAFANRHFIQVTPLINGVGHMRWLVSEREHLDMAEDPQAPVNARVDSAETDKYLFRLYDEAIGLFHSPVMGIGGDEVVQSGRYPFRSRAVYPTAAAAYVAQVRKLHDHLRANGVRTMLWSDTLLGPGEAADSTNAPSLADAQAIRAALPKDILLVDWHYVNADTYPSPELLRNAGFGDVIGATWNDPANIRSFGQTLAAEGQFGLLQTTWVGYESSEKNLQQSPGQFAAFVTAADAAWNGGAAVPRGKPGYDAGALFAKAYAMAIYP